MRPWHSGAAGGTGHRVALPGAPGPQQLPSLPRPTAPPQVCFASSTIWCYNPDNNNARGDCWNGEDLSIFSRDQITGLGGLDDGGRAIKAAVRPHVRAFVGTPLAQRFSMYTREFVFSFTTSPESCPPSPKTPSSLRGWSPSNWDIRRALIPSSPSKSPERDKSSKVRTTARTGSPPSSESFRMSPSSGSSGVSGSGSGSGSVVPPPQLRPPPTQKPRRSDEHGKAGTPPVPEYMLGGEGGQAPIVFFVPRLHYGAKYEFRCVLWPEHDAIVMPRGTRAKLAPAPPAPLA